MVSLHKFTMVRSRRLSLKWYASGSLLMIMVNEPGSYAGIGNHKILQVE